MKMNLSQFGKQQGISPNKPDHNKTQAAINQTLR